MYGILYFVIYGVAFLLTVYSLCVERAEKNVFKPATPFPMQALFGILLWLGIICTVGAINILLFHRFAVFQFTELPAPLMMRFLCFQLLVAVTEELLFRGLLTELGNRLRCHWLTIALISSVLFGVLHWAFQKDMVQFVTAIVLGFVFSTAYQRFKRCTIYSVIIAHFLYDIAIVNVAI